MGQGSDTAAGAMAGASAGAALGPYGALAGGAIGGAMGYFNSGKGPSYTPDQEHYSLPGYEGMDARYNDMLRQGAPQAAQSNFRGDQKNLAGMLMNQARGQGPGQDIAREQASIQTDRGLGQQLAMARSSRPGHGAMAARNAAMASGQLQGRGAQAATMGGLQAQQQAVGQLGGVLQGARGQDLKRNMGNAQMQQRGQLELLSQQLMMNQAQQRGNQTYSAALAGKYGVDIAQPTNQERMMGSAQGIGQAYLQSQAGKGGQG